MKSVVVRHSHLSMVSRARKYEVRKITREEFCDKNLKCKYCKAKLVNKYGKKYVTMEKF
jgi:hypothetical protein